MALSVFPRRDCLLTALLSIEVWKYPGNWENQTQTWPSLEVSAIHQEATFPSQAGCQERPSHQLCTNKLTVDMVLTLLPTLLMEHPADLH